MTRNPAAVTGNRIAVRPAYELHHDAGNWFRAYGDENREFGKDGLTTSRYTSINDLPSRNSSESVISRWGGAPTDT